MRSHFKYITIAYIFATNFVFADSDKFSKTVGLLNDQFKGYTVRRESTKDPNITMLEYQNGPFDLESYSKQRLLGVKFLIKNNGEIAAVIPISFKIPLPSQDEVNSDVNRAIRTSEFLTKNRLQDRSQVQAYGLLNMWAIATLARRDGIEPNLDLSDEQKEMISRVFNGEVAIPLKESKGEVPIEQIEKFAKEIIRYSE